MDIKNNSTTSWYVGEPVNARVQKGDFVVAGVSSNGTRIHYFAIGEVIFVNKYFCTVEFDLEPAGGEKCKLRLSYDITDFNKGMIKIAKYSSGCWETEGRNPIWLNNLRDSDKYECDTRDLNLEPCRITKAWRDFDQIFGKYSEEELCCYGG